MVRTQTEIMEKYKAQIGESLNDEALEFLEDLSDTMKDLETKANGNEDWKTKYEQNDAAWRQKYKDRFFSSGAEEPDFKNMEDAAKPKTFEELFKDK